MALAFGKRADVFSDEKIYYNSWEVASGIMYVWKNWNFSGLMKWRLGNSYAFWEKSMNPYVVSDMRHYLPDTEKQLTHLELHGSLSSVISVKVLVNVLKIVEERVRYFNNGGPFIGFRVSPAWGRC